MEEHGGLDLDGLSPDSWEQLTVQAETHIARLRALQVACLQRLDRAQVASADGHRSLADWAAARLDVDHSTARRLTHTARALVDLPHTAAALAEGEISFDRAHQLSRLATPTTETRLLEEAEGWDLARLRQETARRQRITRSHEQDAARHHHYLMIQPDLFHLCWKLWGRLTATDGAIVEQALQQRADRLPTLPDGNREPHRVRMATALASLAHDTLDADLPTDIEPRRGGGPELTIFLDGDLAEHTNGEAGAEIATGPRIGPQALEEILCTGRVGILRHLPTGDLIRVGDHTQAIPPSVRRFVFYRHGGICTVDGCTSRYRLQPHHRQQRIHRGDNHPNNLPLMCWYHHHRIVHQLGYTIDPASPPGRIRLLPPERDPP